MKTSMFRKSIRKVQSRIGMPVLSSMQLEITNHCNFHCSMCPTHCKNSQVTRPKGYMSLDHYSRILNEFCALGGRSVIPQGAGESTIHPDFIPMMEIAKKQHGLRVAFNSNGSLFNETLIKQLFELGVDEIGFSIDACSPGVFHRITGKNILNEVENKMMQMVEMRRSNSAKSPFLRVLLVEQTENRSEIPAYIEKWIPHVDEVVIQVMRIRHGRELPNGRSEDRGPCGHLFNTVFVQWDGDVTICCEDWNSEAIIGNTHVSDLKDIWFGETMRTYREMQRQKHFFPPENLQRLSGMVRWCR